MGLLVSRWTVRKSGYLEDQRGESEALVERGNDVADYMAYCSGKVASGLENWGNCKDQNLHGLIPMHLWTQSCSDKKLF